MIELPADFATRTRRLMGEDLYTSLCAALQETPSVSVRLHPDKGLSAPAGWEAVPWCAGGYYLPERPSFTFDPLFHAGAYYVQEASSMFLQRVLRTFVTNPVRMLDLCAAPGGKSTLACASLPEGSLLVANEVMRQRVRILEENLLKWGDERAVVTCNDPSDFTSLPHLFDVILTDAPCSGEGMFRKDDQALADWSLANVNLCQQRQRRILSDVWPALKPGGILIYSTCTYNREENEDNVEWMARHLGAEVLPVPVEPAWNITGNLVPDDTFPVYRFLPGHTRGEGLFMAVLRKSANEEEEECPLTDKRRKKKASGKAGMPPVPAEAREWIKDPEEYAFQNEDGMVTAVPALHADVIRLLREKLRVKHAGIDVLAAKGKLWQPCPSLAFSRKVNRAACPVVELSWQDAISFLRKEAFPLQEEVPLGYVLFTYHHLPIGFGKNLGGRFNILYPNEWRIRSSAPAVGIPLLQWP